MKTVLPLGLVTLLLWLLGCKEEPPMIVEIEQGLPLKVAEQRSGNISELQYELKLQIPDALEDSIQGVIHIKFDLANGETPLVIDFNTTESHVLEVYSRGELVDWQWSNGHIVLHPSSLDTGPNTITINFIAGESSLNRNEEYLYTLFVPDRASFAFPCFDQPDLKGLYLLHLDVPQGWTAVGNGPLTRNKSMASGSSFTFTNDQPISTYLFAFAAGRFEVISREVEGREMSLYHRETDSVKVANNVDEIFALHARSLEWLEDYTDTPYPFQKFDFALIPSFQYGGMEHPGSIFYRASSLFLEPSASIDQQLGRASLIAHETAHMWFGDLVTMKWFNDVWMKEVFANFMAAKIINPSFPDVNHDLRFFLAHYPRAYAIDRSQGTHPIRQPLDNLKDAGTLYGSIIYQKAPIVMRHLEDLVGEEGLRDGLRDYLKEYAYGNADWPQLIEILDEQSPLDLNKWSQIWVEEAGMPTIQAEVLNVDEDHYVFRLNQKDFSGNDLKWHQRMTVAAHEQFQYQLFEMELKDSIADRMINFLPTHILPNSKGRGYGYFQLTPRTIEYLLDRLHEITEPLIRGTALVALWEEMLNGRVRPDDMLEVLLLSLSKERDPQMAQRMLNYMEACFWKFHTEQEWVMLASELEPELWTMLRQSRDPGIKIAYLRTLRSIALTDESVGALYQIWKGTRTIPGLTLGENDRTELALELAWRRRDGNNILQEELERVKNIDRKHRLQFIMPALDHDTTTRAAFFESLKDPAQRSQEPWVLTALAYLHHPTRTSESGQYIRPSLELLEEIQRTGDIFFPKRWLDATLGGYQSDGAADIVTNFLAERPDYPLQLRRKVLQSSDLLFRAASITRGQVQPE